VSSKKKKNHSAGVAWWSSALAPSREDARLIPNPGNPFPNSHSRDWCFIPLPGSGWQVLFDSQHGSIGSEKPDTLQKFVAGHSQNPIHKKNLAKKKKKERNKKETVRNQHSQRNVFFPIVLDS
jgi:hypothetical protein